MLSDELVPLPRAARTLRVPSPWLRGEVEAGRIPALRAGARYLIHLPTVERMLAERAAQETQAREERRS